MPLTQNVSSQFNNLIMFGILINGAYMLVLMKHGCHSEKTKKKIPRKIFMAEGALWWFWWAHMICLISVRFSRPGMVCSGDYYQMESMEPNGLV
jgi:hypothetical protein